LFFVAYRFGATAPHLHGCRESQAMSNSQWNEDQAIGEAALRKFAKEREELPAKLEKLRMLLQGFEEEIARAERNIQNRGKGGQHVPFHGDFANVPPFGLSRLRWWARAFQEVLGVSE